MKIFRTASSVAVAALVASAAPATAQDSSAETVRQQVVYGDDECSEPTNDNETVVCVIVVEGERYRVPEMLRGNPNSSENQAWATKIERIEQISRFGTQSCSPAGVGGFTGCTQQLIEAAVAAAKQDNRVDWTAAISAQRQERIDEIDANARRAEQAYIRQEANREAREAEMAAARARLEEREACEARNDPNEDCSVDAQTTADLTTPPGADQNPE